MKKKYTEMYLREIEKKLSNIENRLQNIENLLIPFQGKNGFKRWIFTMFISSTFVVWGLIDFVKTIIKAIKGG